MDMVKIIYSNISKTAFWLCLVCSIALITGGFFAPPMGVIDGSLLKAVGELFGFATLGVIADAVRKGSDIKLKKGDVELELNNPDANATD